MLGLFLGLLAGGAAGFLFCAMLSVGPAE